MFSLVSLDASALAAHSFDTAAAFLVAWLVFLPRGPSLPLGVGCHAEVAIHVSWGGLLCFIYCNSCFNGKG